MARKNRKKKTRAQKMAGGSMMSPPEREEYQEGSLASTEDSMLVPPEMEGAPVDTYPKWKPL